MARCRATIPCNYKANGEVHDHGCPERAKGWPDEPAEHVELYATETPEERATLDDVLVHLVDRDLIDTLGYADVVATDVSGGWSEWITLRRRIRNGATDPEQIAAGIALRWDTEDGEAWSGHGTPELVTVDVAAAAPALVG